MGTEKFNGKVKWFNNQKGFGFIQIGEDDDKDKQDIFVHFSGIKAEGFKSLEDGQLVEFEIKDGPKGRQAVEVVKIEG